MTAAQCFKIYEVLGKHFHNAKDARVVVTEIEQIIETKISDKKDILATKEDIGLLRLDFLKLHIDMEKRFNQLTIWIVGTTIALAGLIIAIT